MKKPKLSIIILSYNTKKILKQCLDSIINGLANSRIKKIKDWGVEIIVVDNGSTDGSEKFLRDIELKKYRNIESKSPKRYNSKFLNVYNFLSLKIIFNKKNVGFAKGNNQGIKIARGEYLMLLNSDTIVKRGSLERLVFYLEENPNTAVSPLLLLPNGKPQQDYYMRFPNLWQIFLYHHPLIRPLIIRSFLKKFIFYESKKEPFEVDQLPGAALVSLKKVWDEVGFLDEDYHFLFEDVDWCWRAKRKGIKLIVNPLVKIIHKGGASWKKKIDKNSADFYYQFFASMLLFTKKNYGKFKGEIFKWAIILNFLLTLKPKTAWLFWKNKGKQKELWQ